MDTKEALEMSIKHWEEIRTVVEDNIGSTITRSARTDKINEQPVNIFADACALCSLFRDHGCKACPVAEYGTRCDDSESTWAEVHIRFGRDMSVDENLLSAINAQVVFLKSLRKQVAESAEHEGLCKDCRFCVNHICLNHKSTFFNDTIDEESPCMLCISRLSPREQKMKDLVEKWIDVELVDDSYVETVKILNKNGCHNSRYLLEGLAKLGRKPC